MIKDTDSVMLVLLGKYDPYIYHDIKDLIDAIDRI